jgi:uncharacterized repeat protein (TIGR02543 family)
VKKSYDIKVYFTTSNGLSKTADFETINLDCVQSISPAGNVVEEDVSGEEEAIIYTVNFDSQGADVNASPASKTVTSPNTTVGELPTEPTKDGYTFDGWYTAVSGGGTLFTDSTEVVADITVYANWTLPTYAVTYNGNGNTGGTVPSDQTKTKDVTLVLQTNSGNLVKTGYTFDGWNTAADGSGTSYAEGANYTVNAGLTLYAKWTEASTLGDGLVAHFLMNDDAASSDVVNTMGDSAKFMDTGAYENTEDNTTTGKINAALITTVDNPISDGDYIATFQSFTSTFQGSYTITFWIKPTDAVLSYINTVFQLNDSDSSLRLYVNGNPTPGSGKLYIDYTANSVGLGGAYTASRVFADDGPYDWTYLTFIVDADANQLYLYNNAALIEMDPAKPGDLSDFPNELFDASDSTYGLTFSGDVSGGQLRPIGATYDDIRIYNRALTTDEITELYNSGNGTEEE